MKKRENFIDIVRAIAIILVVFCHCSNFESPNIIRFINLFFMPLFIFLSGYLYKNKEIYTIRELVDYLKKKTKKLYLFYLKYELIFLIFRNFFFKIGFYDSNILYGDRYIYPINSLLEFIKVLLEIVFLMGRELFCGAFWFIISLIFIIIGYSIINYVAYKLRKKINKNLTVNILTILVFIVGCIMSKTINIPRLSPAFTLMIFYHIGNLCYKNQDKLKFNNLIIAVLSLIILIHMSYYISIDMSSNVFPNGFLLIVSSISGIYLTLFLSKKIDKYLRRISSFLIYIGKNTMPIIAMHFISFKFASLTQYLFNVIPYEKIAYLNGYANDNLWILLYLISGIGIPLLINHIYIQLNSRRSR